MQHVEIIWAFCLPGFLSYLLSFSVPWENNDGFWWAGGGGGGGGVSAQADTNAMEHFYFCYI